MESTTHGWFGRESESAAIDRLLIACRERPAMLVFQGDPGIGKSVLMRSAVERARAAGIHVLAATPHRAEMDLALAGLGDLLSGVGADVLAGMPEPLADALDVALLRRAVTGPAPGPRALGLATGMVLDRIAQLHGCLMLVIDDVHWLDRSSADVLGFAWRRLGERPVGVLLARRPGPTGTLDEALPDLPTERVTVRPLTLGATHALVSSRTRIVLSRPDLRRFHDLTRGNPLHALELGQALRDGTASLAPGSAVPPDLGDLLRARVAGLSEPARHVLAAAAASARPTVASLGAALTGVHVPHALAAAAAVDVLAIEGGSVTFRHPLLAAAAYSGIGADQRRRLHGLLAATEPDELERARHLALAADGPDAAVSAVVEQAARQAFERGAPSAAADLCALARSLVPPGWDEVRDRLNLAEAEYRFEAGDTAGADELLASLLANSRDARSRTAALSQRARIRHFAADVAGGVALAREALRGAASDDPHRGMIAEGLAWGLLLMRGDTDEAAGHARLAVEIAEAHGSPVALAEALAVQALAEMTVGRTATATMHRALELEPSMGRVRVLRYPSFAHAWMLTAQDRFEEARTVLEQLHRRAEDQGDDSSAAPLLTHLSTIDILTGRLGVAVERAGAAADLAYQSGQLPTRVAALGRRALALVRRGEEEAGRETAEAALALAAGEGADGEAETWIAARGGEAAAWALAELAVRQGRPAEAADRLWPLAVLMRASGVQEPGEVRFLPVLIDALVASDRGDQAEPLIMWLEALASATGRRSALASATAGRGTILAASGHLVAAAERLALAVEHAGAVPMPFETCRIRLRLGNVLRRAARKREASEVLAAAEAGFRSIGAERWAELASVERRAIGARGRQDGPWTATERRVAELVAEGATNKEIAARLFVSPKAVEATLTRLFARTSIRSRAELATRYARELAEPPAREPG